MLRKKKAFRAATNKKLFTPKKTQALALKRRRLSFKQRLFRASRNRLQRAQLRLLRPVYCRVYRQKKVSSSMYSSQILVARTIRCVALRSRRTRQQFGYCVPSVRGVLRRTYFYRSGVAVRAPRGNLPRRSGRKLRFGRGSSRWGYRRNLVLFRRSPHYRGLRFSPRSTYRLSRKLRRVSLRTLRMMVSGRRIRTVTNSSARAFQSIVLCRGATRSRASVVLYRERRLRIRGRRFRRRRYTPRRTRTFSGELFLHKYTVKQRIVRRRKRRAFYRRLPLRTARQVLGTVLSQRTRWRKRRILREYFNTKRSFSLRTLSALRYRLSRSNPKG